MVLSEKDIREWLYVLYDTASTQSDDRSNQNAAVILFDSGYTIGVNRIPTGVTKTDQRICERPTKYAYIEHAEREAIFTAAKWGQRTHGRTMICPWFACADCARAIVLAGITTVIGHKQRMDMTNVGREQVKDTVANRWASPVSDGDTILKEAGIETIYYDGHFDVDILINEQRITYL